MITMRARSAPPGSRRTKPVIVTSRLASERAGVRYQPDTQPSQQQDGVFGFAAHAEPPGNGTPTKVGATMATTSVVGANRAAKARSNAAGSIPGNVMKMIVTTGIFSSRPAH
jgi:hypothetical protein